MTRKVLPFIAVAVSAILLGGCAAVASGAGSADRAATPSISASASAFSDDLSPAAVIAANADATTVNENEWSAEPVAQIALQGASATADGVSGVAVDASTVTITEAGVYRLSGSLSGQVVVDAPDDALVVLILDNAEIDNAEGSAIEVRSADDVAIHLADGSRNTVSDASSYADDATANSAIDASTDLTISGNGALSVRGNGNDGIASTDDLVILSGEIDVTAADDALRGKDALVVEGGSLSLTATAGEGLKSDQEQDDTQGYVLVRGGDISITAGDDGVQAQTDTIITGGRINAAVADDGIKGETTVSIGDGEVTVSASVEAVEAVNIGIFGGTIDVTATDDGINASGLNTGGQDRETDTGERLEISGGTISVQAGMDGLDSNGTITISGGTVDITSADNGGESPIDANGEVVVSGGTVTANGAEYDPATARQMPGAPGGAGDGAGGAGEMPGGAGEMPGGPGGGARPEDTALPGA